MDNGISDLESNLEDKPTYNCLAVYTYMLVLNKPVIDS